MPDLGNAIYSYGPGPKTCLSPRNYDFLVYHVRASYSGRDRGPLTLSQDDFRIFALGKGFNSRSVLFPNDALPSGLKFFRNKPIKPGQTIEGDIVFEAETGVKPITIYYRPLATPGIEKHPESMRTG